MQKRGSKFLFLAGLIPLFPTFAVMAHVMAGNSGGLMQ